MKELEELMELYRKTTQGQWRPSRWGKDECTPYSPDELKIMLCEMIDTTIKHGDSVPWFYGVHSSVDPDGTPVSPILTGIGPTSEINALFSAALHNFFPALYERIRVAERMAEMMIGFVQLYYHEIGAGGEKTDEDVITEYRTRALAELKKEGIDVEL